MSLSIRKHAFGHECQEKIRISVDILVFWSESLLGTVCLAKNIKILYEDKKDSDQAVQSVQADLTYVERSVIRYVFSSCGSYVNIRK